MKKNELILMSAMAFATLIACHKTPEASISVDKTTAKVNEAITVTSTSQDANTYAWLVFDGANGSGEPSSHAIRVSGGYQCDDTYAFKIDSVGEYRLRLDAYYYPDGCGEGKDIGKYDDASTKITITL
jgi:hypothetical protein